MSYQIAAYSFLKALYNEHVLMKTDLRRMDFEKIREIASIQEADGILELIVTFLRGKNLIHVSYPSSNLNYKTYYISEHGIKCINSFECARAFNEANSILSEILHANNFKRADNEIITPQETISEELCQEFFSKIKP